MKIKLISFFAIINTLIASPQNFVFSNASKLENHKIGLEYIKINDTIDILNLKENELSGTGINDSTFGDMDAYKLNGAIDLKYVDLYLSYELSKLTYSGTELENRELTYFIKIPIIKNSSDFFTNISLDLGQIKNSAPDIYIKDELFINKMIKKLSPTTSYSLDNGSIKSANGSSFTFYNRDGKKIYPHYSIKNMEDSSTFIKTTLNKKFSFLDLNFFAGYKTTDIKTKINFEYENNSFVKSIIGNRDSENLSRDEKTIFYGINLAFEVNRFLFQGEYSIYNIDRDSSLSINSKSNEFDGTMSYLINKNTAIYLGGKIMFNQFNSKLPYLFNKGTKTTFDKKYGFARLGIVYSF